MPDEGHQAGWASLLSHLKNGIWLWVHPRHHQGLLTFPWKNNLESIVVAEEHSLVLLLGFASRVPPLHPAGTPGQDGAAGGCTGPADGMAGWGQGWVPLLHLWHKAGWHNRDCPAQGS